MAVSNSIGSNIFDVLLGLGFPWALRTLIVSYGSVVTTADLTRHPEKNILLTCYLVTCYIRNRKSLNVVPHFKEEMKTYLYT